MYNNYFMCLLLLDVFLNTKEIYKEKAQMIKDYSNESKNAGEIII